MTIYYRPSDGIVGDIAPFYWQGQYHAFFLKAPLPPLRNEADHTSYGHVVSSDLVHWQEWPIVIHPGDNGETDSVSCWTGSVIEANGVFHLFYTGYSGAGEAQVVCRATSRDLRSWTKDPANPVLRADPRWYEPLDWRDPYVFWNAEAREFWMLLAARIKDGPANRRGCTALAVSPDLEQWEIRPPFWSPRLFQTHECPDLFRWSGWWVLIFSEFSESKQTHYRVSTSLWGPWLAPRNDTFDARGFYAAKTASDGLRRFVFGWNPTKEGMVDEGPWQWGGNLVVHEIVQHSNGTLAVKLPEEIKSYFKNSTRFEFTPQIGQWQIGDFSASVEAIDNFAWCHLSDTSNTFMIKTKIKMEHMTRGCGILLRAGKDLEHYYQVRLEPLKKRIVFDRSPRPGDEPFMLENFLNPKLGDTVKIKVVVDHTIVEIYVDDNVALSTRGYNHCTGSIGLFVSEGKATFFGTEICIP